MSLPCPRRPHELRASTMPWRHSFFGFAGPVDGARGELTRQGAPLFPHFETKRSARGQMQKKPRALGAARGEVGGPRGVAIATQRCDSATPSFIPPLNNKRRAARLQPARAFWAPSRRSSHSTRRSHPRARKNASYPLLTITPAAFHPRRHMGDPSATPHC